MSAHRTRRARPPASLAVAASIAGLALAAGCRPAPPEAPTELDALVHFFHQELDGDDTALVLAGAANLELWFDGSDEVVDGWTQGLVSDLSADEVALLDEMTWAPDPSVAVGVYLLAELGCSLAQMMEIYLDPDQLALFPGNYDAYERTFDSDADCFADGSCDQVDWHSAVEDSIIGFSMTYRLITRMRRFADTGADDASQVVLGRNVMPEPAVESLSGGGFEQSYHIEAYLPRGADRTLHLYGLWNHGYVDGVSEDLAFWPNQYLDGLVEWDERIEELCAGSR